MFSHKHYVPILRWKWAEKNALKHLDEGDKKKITPLVELIPPAKPRPLGKNQKPPKTPKKLKTVADVMSDTPEEILLNWGLHPIFVDLRLLKMSEVITEITNMYAHARALKLKMIPVVDISSNEAYLATITTIIKKDGGGACLRLYREDLKKKNLMSEIKLLMRRLELQEENMDLFIDLQIIDQEHEYSGFLANIQEISKWRTFTIAGGAFPIDLSSGFIIGANLKPRLDWQTWCGKKNTKGLPRRPSYSDYTIQHPVYREVDFPAVSRSIRYTAPDNWVVMKGQADKAKGSEGTKQYLAHALLLSKRLDYCGEGFSYGDGYIKEKGSDLKSKKTGGPKEWLLAGINHHLKLVIHQIASLS